MPARYSDSMAPPPRALLASASELASQIRRGTTTSREVVAAHIEAIRRVNPSLNAMVRDRFDDAMKEAAAADARVSSEPTASLPPLIGVPCTIKECFAVRGMPQSAGLKARRDVVASADATVVSRLQDAGAIVLGVSNTSELCMWMESDNRVYGRTNNPYDPSRSAGGSSGGEASLVGAGLSPFGLGSDVGGSIRIPAGFCGVFGHKPSGGLVPSTGQYPIAKGGAQTFLTTGPLTRRAEDLMPILRLLAGPDGSDLGCAALPLVDPSEHSLADHPVFIARFPRRAKISPTQLKATEDAAIALESTGARCREIDMPAFAKTLAWWAAGLTSDGNAPYRKMLGLRGPWSLLRQFARLPLRRADHTLPSLVLASVDRRVLGAQTQRRLLDHAQRCSSLIQEKLGTGIMIAPSYPRVAPRHGHAMMRPFAAYATLVFNVLELPVTQVPMGLDKDGVPTGVQIVASHGHDHRTICAAQHLERRFGGWTPPSRLWSNDVAASPAASL